MIRQMGTLSQGPYRHYVLNAIWILINLLCIMLTIYHLRKLYRDFTKSNIEALRVHRLFSAAIKEESHQVLLLIFFKFYQ